MSKKHKELTRDFYQNVVSPADTTRISEFCHDHMTFRSSLGHFKDGIEGFAEFLTSIGNALDGFKCAIDDIISERNKVCARFTFSGIHTGDLLLFQATGAHVRWEGVALITFKSGKIIDIWTLGDVRSLLRQLADASA
ncbi:MAG: ester cyclase [Alphaproteobacteria bacterium]|nr:ester cyclase [Alphaproteobacteria bacterium]